MTILWNNVLVFFSVQLLVNNKIISLDLPVAEVYKKVWCTTNEVRARFLACGVGWLPDVVAVAWLACSSTEDLSFLGVLAWEKPPPCPPRGAAAWGRARSCRKGRAALASQPGGQQSEEAL